MKNVIFKADELERGCLDLIVMKKNSTFLKCVPGFSCTFKNDSLCSSTLHGKQLFKNVFCRNDVKHLAQVAGVCPVEEI